MPNKQKRKALALKELLHMKKKFAKLERAFTDNYSTSSDSDSSQESCSSSTRESPREIEEPCQTTPPLEPVVLSDTLQIPQNVEVNKKIVELLGENPINQNKKGKALHEELVVRWSNYLTEGIPVETRKELILKYPASENCAPLQAPKMNDEIKSILSAQAMKNDTFFTNLQTQLGAGLTIIGSILTEKLSTTSNDADNELVQKLSDASQLFASVHHAVSVKRKWEVNPSINQDSRVAAQKSTIDEYLFGSGFIDRVNSCQAMKKASENIKNKPFKTSYSHSAPGTSTGHTLNSRRHVFNTKMKRDMQKRRQGTSRDQKKKFEITPNRYHQHQPRTPYYK